MLQSYVTIPARRPDGNRPHVIFLNLPKDGPPPSQDGILVGANYGPPLSGIRTQTGKPPVSRKTRKQGSF